MRFYPALAAAFEPYAEAGKSQSLSDGKRTRGSTFDPVTAAHILVRVIDLSGTSSRPDLKGTDEFDKEDAEFALELGVKVLGFRAARRFLACDVNLIGHRVLRLPNRTIYRPIWPRIQQFFFGASSGIGWGQMPLGTQEPPADRPARPHPPSVEITNSECVNNTLGVTKKQTPSDEKTHSFRKDLYRKDCTEKQKIVDVVVDSPAITAWKSTLGHLLQTKIGIDPPICYELAETLAGVWGDSGRKPHEIALRIDAALTNLQGIQAITNPTGKLIADLRRDPLLTGKRYEVARQTGTE